MTRETGDSTGRARTTTADLSQVYGRVVSLAIGLDGMQAAVLRLREDIEDLIAGQQEER